MADEQSHESVSSGRGKLEANESHEKKAVVENGAATVCPVESVKEGLKSHDNSATNCTSADHNHTNHISGSESSQVLQNERVLSTETKQTDHSEENYCQDKCKEEKIEKNESVPCETSAAEEGNNCLSDDQKSDKIADQGKNEIISPSQGESEKLVEVQRKEEHSIERETQSEQRTVESKTPADEHNIETEPPTEEHNKSEKNDTEREMKTVKHSIERETSIEEFSGRSAEVMQVEDDNIEEASDEPSTEAYYTSNFTFVCQKSHEEKEQKKSEEIISVSEKMEQQEIFEANFVKQSEELSDKETAPQTETSICDNNADVAVVSDANEVTAAESLCEMSNDAFRSEYSEDTEEGRIETSYSSELLSYEHTMTSHFQETTYDEAGNIIMANQLTNEKNEYESEIDVDAYNKMNNTADEENDIPDRTESATPDSDVELKTEKIERPSHFVRLKPTGVQKTERPYDCGTTESKIAMEIREMREREEELRLMRERLQSPEGNTSISPQLSPTSWKQKSPQESPEPSESGPGYRVSTVFGHKGSPAQSPVEEEKKIYRSFSKESAVEKEIRIARNREEELRKEKGLPPREDDSYIKPSQVKSAQVRVFGKMNAPNTSKELATTKIQQEIEEQTLREMALREKGHIQTISQERTDSKVAKLKDLDVSLPECTSPTSPNGYGSFSDLSSKRSTPSPTGSSHGSIPPVPRPVNQGKGISMQKFIASKGKETTFIASRNGPSHPEQNADASRSNPMMRRAKRSVSVESKIQQEILEMKLREEELRRMHNSSGPEQSFLTSGENGTDLGSATNDDPDYVNGQEINGSDESGPSHNNLIAQWEQRIQKAEGNA